MITDVTDRPAPNFLANAPVECSISSSLTSLETLYIEHKWTVDSFTVHMDLSPVAEYLTSPVFGSKDSRYKFNLRLYPTGKDEECRSYVSLFLMIRECPGQKIRFKVNFFVETTDGPKYCALNRHVVAINKGGIVTASKFFAVEFLKNRSQRFLPNDTLTVGVQLAIFGDTVSSDVPREEMAHVEDFSAPDPNLSPDFQSMLDNEMHSDCELVVVSGVDADLGVHTEVVETNDTSDGSPSTSTATLRREVFRCHKAVLAARSPVFAAMFANDMQEASSNRCTIDDLTPESVRAVLQFFYSGTCPQIEAFAEEILPAADKYQVIWLKNHCEYNMANKLSLENICRFLKLADKHSAPMLRKKVLAFCQEHKKEVLAPEVWDSIQLEDPQLAAQTLRQMLTGIDCSVAVATESLGTSKNSTAADSKPHGAANGASAYTYERAARVRLGGVPIFVAAPLRRPTADISTPSQPVPKRGRFT